MMKKNLEMKVGAFVLGGVVLLIAGIFFTKDFSLFKRYYLINIEFEFSEGLKKSSPVRLSGVDIGEIKDVNVILSNGTYKVIASARVENKVKIPVDSSFFINSLGVLGEKYIEIIPGVQNTFLVNNQQVKGISPIPLRKITESANMVISGMRDFLEDAGFKESFRDFVKNLRESSYQLKTLLEDKSSKELLTNVKDASASLKQLLEDMRTAQGTVGKLIYDPSLYNELEGLVEDIRANPWKLIYKTKSKPKRK